METSKLVVDLAANPGVVRAGADQRAENPSGAASRNPSKVVSAPGSPPVISGVEIYRLQVVGRELSVLVWLIA